MFFTASAGMPHVAAFFSTYLTTLASASVKWPMSLQASAGVALRSLAVRTALARFSAALRKFMNSTAQGGSCPAGGGAGAACPGNCPGACDGNWPGADGNWPGICGNCPGPAWKLPGGLRRELARHLRQRPGSGQGQRKREWQTPPNHWHNPFLAIHNFTLKSAY